MSIAESLEQQENAPVASTHCLIRRQTLINVADAIREKTGESELIPLSDFVDEISSISTGTEPSGKITFTQNGTDIDIASYATADVNVTNEPTKGYIFTEYDSDGYPTKAKFVGDWTEVPINFTASDNSSAVKFFKRIETIEFAPTITTIGYSAFRFYSALSSITLPASTGTVGGYAFRDCGLVEIKFLGDVTYIETGAFAGSALKQKRFIVGGTVASNAWKNPFLFSSADASGIELYDFSHCENVFTLQSVYNLPHAAGCVIKVPAAKLSEWQAETNWCDLPTDPNDPWYVVWQGV